MEPSVVQWLEGHSPDLQGFITRGGTGSRTPSFDLQGCYQKLGHGIQPWSWKTVCGGRPSPKESKLSNYEIGNFPVLQGFLYHAECRGFCRTSSPCEGRGVFLETKNWNSKLTVSMQ